MEMWPCRHTINNALRENLGMECMDDGRVKNLRPSEIKRSAMIVLLILERRKGSFT